MGRTSTVTEKGQATIPKELRDKYGIETGDEVVWEETEEGIVLRKQHESARGALVPDDIPDEKREAIAQALEDEIRAIRDRDQLPGSSEE
jgi:AbrB family looped-hinge helix DNA binding protein